MDVWSKDSILFGNLNKDSKKIMLPVVFMRFINSRLLVRCGLDREGVFFS